MRFNEKAIWDDSDLDYAPCLRRTNGTFYWIPPKKYLKAGFSIKTYNLGGEDGDGQDRARAAMCRELTRELLLWWQGETAGREPGTWGWIIGRYLSDEYSGIWDVRPATREKYRKELARIEAAIGNSLISETDYTTLMRWQRNMRDKGRSKSYIHKWFTHWGLALSHGVKLGDEECRRIKSIRSEIRFGKGKARTVYPTWDEVQKIVAHADAEGAHWLALSVLLRFELNLRGTDVYGQWEPSEGQTGGIQYQPKGATKKRVWVDGITWDMIDPDVSRLVKTISKTRESDPDEITFDLTLVPDIRRRLLEIPREQRVGPVIKCEDGLPPRNGREGKVFRRIVAALKLDEDLQLRDTRAGGITEAGKFGNPLAVQHAAQHSNLGTTQRYLRDRDGNVNAVIAFRQKGRTG